MTVLIVHYTCGRIVSSTDLFLISISPGIFFIATLFPIANMLFVNQLNTEHRQAIKKTDPNMTFFYPYPHFRKRSPECRRKKQKILHILFFYFSLVYAVPFFLLNLVVFMKKPLSISTGFMLIQTNCRYHIPPVFLQAKLCIQLTAFPASVLLLFLLYCLLNSLLSLPAYQLL